MLVQILLSMEYELHENYICLHFWTNKQLNVDFEFCNKILYRNDCITQMQVLYGISRVGHVYDVLLKNDITTNRLTIKNLSFHKDPTKFSQEVLIRITTKNKSSPGKC